MCRDLPYVFEHQRHRLDRAPGGERNLPATLVTVCLDDMQAVVVLKHVGTNGVRRERLPHVVSGHHGHEGGSIARWMTQRSRNRVMSRHGAPRCSRAVVYVRGRLSLLREGCADRTGHQNGLSPASMRSWL